MANIDSGMNFDNLKSLDPCISSVKIQSRPSERQSDQSLA